MPHLNKHARASFRFGVPGAHFLSFEGPGGDAVAQGELFMKQTRCMCCDVTSGGLMRNVRLQSTCDEPSEDHLPVPCRV